ncbi:MAG TPA: methyl-accepting chemotaxis protein, partial [Pseudomonas sp.]|nr:methyl-accepting chemotaxis protein [Pseudomonas sp.]
MFGPVMNLRIGSKLLLAFTVLIVGAGSLLFTTLERFVNLQHAEEQLFKRSYERISDVKELRLNLAAQRAELQLAISDGDASDYDGHEAEIRRASEANDQLLKRLRVGVAEDPEASGLLEELETLRNLVAQTRTTQVLPLIRSGQHAEAQNLNQGVQRERLNAINALGLQLVELTDQRVAQSLEQSRATLGALRDRLFNLSLALVLGSGLLAWLLSRHIAQPLARLTGWAEQIGRGEIPREMSSDSRQDEVGRLGQAFVSMSHYLRELVLELNEGIAVLAASSEEILAATTQVAASTQETATAISE